MQISFANQSSLAVRLTVHGNPYVLPAGQPAVLELAEHEPILAQVDACKPPKKKDRSRRLVVETEYRLSGLADGSRILLTREKIPIDVNISYDRVFLHPMQGQIIREAYRVVNLPHVQAQQEKGRMVNNLFREPMRDFLLECLLELLFHPIRTLLVIAVAIGLGIHFGWYWIPVLLLAMLLLMGLVNAVLDPLLEKLMCRITGVPTERERLQKHCTQEALSAFYAQPERKPFAGQSIEH